MLHSLTHSPDKYALGFSGDRHLNQRQKKVPTRWGLTPSRRLARAGQKVTAAAAQS